MTDKLIAMIVDPGTRYIVVDLEATCWEAQSHPPNEIIEIGAVAYEVGVGIRSEFQSFVRPKIEPVLSDFCKQLTAIRQEDVDVAPGFPSAYAAFQRWRQAFNPSILASWGDYDLKQIMQDCALHQMDVCVDRHISLKSAFADISHCKECGMAAALRRIGLPREGTHHRGIDDARNIVRILEWMLNAMRQGQP